MPRHDKLGDFHITFCVAPAKIWHSLAWVLPFWHLGSQTGHLQCSHTKLPSTFFKHCRQTISEADLGPRTAGLSQRIISIKINVFKLLVFV